MLKLDTHAIQMIAICTILISTIFLGYLEFKRLHYKLDSISSSVKTLEDLNTINKGVKGAIGKVPLNLKEPLATTTQIPISSKSVSNGGGDDSSNVKLEQKPSSPVEKSSENLVNQIFNNEQEPVPKELIEKEVEKYDDLDDGIIDNLENMDFLKHSEEEEQKETQALENNQDMAQEYLDNEEYSDKEEDEEEEEEEEQYSDKEGTVKDSQEVNKVEELDGLEISLNNELNNKKLKELRGILKERGLSQSGSKTDCINRIIKDMSKN